MQVNWIRSLWGTAKHSAFTDLCGFKNSLFCCFREATNHISGDGRIRVIKLDEEGNIIAQSALQVAGTDYRDPKLSVAPDGKLLLHAYARQTDEHGRTTQARNVCWFSADGLSWSTERFFGKPFWWCWRLRWFGNQAMGLAYNRTQQRIDLYSGNPRASFHLLKSGVLSYNKHGLGYPNESDMLMTADGKAIALVRRDADTCTAQLGESRPPYHRWQWTDLGCYIGGPVMLPLTSSRVVISGRYWRAEAPVTAIWTLDLNTRKLKLEMTLPSAGDTSYPGMVIREKTLWLSYYSSHVDDTSRIYLANISL